MIEKILERLREERIKEQEFRSKRLKVNALRDANDAHERIMTLNKIEAIVQEVAKEYGNGWIPVEVAMPTEGGWYRVTCDYNGGNTYVRDLYYNPTLNEFVDNIRYTENCCRNIKRFIATKYVIAWKKQIAPYQKGE